MVFCSFWSLLLILLLICSFSAEFFIYKELFFHCFSLERLIFMAKPVLKSMKDFHLKIIAAILN